MFIILKLMIIPLRIFYRDIKFVHNIITNEDMHVKIVLVWRNAYSTFTKAKYNNCFIVKIYNKLRKQ